MDVKDDGFFDENESSIVVKANENETPMSATKEIKLPFPPEDYDKKGRLKRVRKRMFKKLFKSELRFYLPIMLCLMGVMALSGLLFGICLKQTKGTWREVDHMGHFLTVFSGFLFVISCSGGILFMNMHFPNSRYNKNFFQGEGYLTFSIPASMEEHVLSKRIAAFLCSWLTNLVMLFTVLIVVIINGGWDELKEVLCGIFSGKPVHAVFFSLEYCISFLLGSFTLLCVMGAGNCLLSRYVGKRRTGMTLLIVFIVITLLQAASSFLVTVGIDFIPDTAAEMHLFAWLGIFVQAAICVGCVFFEIHYLKNKLDLK